VGEDGRSIPFRLRFTDLLYEHHLALHVKDDGVGIDPTIGDRGTEGHFGLRTSGLRESEAN
jgi:nitrate/nitrite-specific signal transduction histidine kinase